MTIPAVAAKQIRGTTRPSWEVRASHEIYNNGFFRLRRDECTLTRTPVVTTDLYVLEMPDVVSIVPLTTDGRLVMVEQYRHGSDCWLLECPGGVVSATDLSRAATASRELREETGYAAGELEFLGSHYLNASGQTNQVHTYLARGCRLDGGTDLDRFENLRVRLLTPAELSPLLRGGAQLQTTTLASLMLAMAALNAEGF